MQNKKSTITQKLKIEKTQKSISKHCTSLGIKKKLLECIDIVAKLKLP